MRIHCLQHVPFEGPAAIADWAATRGHRLTLTKLYAGEELPGVEEFDWLIVMGGPMNIYQDAQYPWLAGEKALIGQAVAAGRTLLGVCLGAQLLADRLGSRVFRGEHREIGWWPLHLAEAGRRSSLFAGLPEPLEAFHWHGDTFESPPGAVCLAASAACANQAFLYDERVLGLQFHFEVTPASVRLLVKHCGDEIVPGRYVQSAEQLLGVDEAVFAQLNRTLFTVLDRLADNTRRPSRKPSGPAC